MRTAAACDSEIKLKQQAAAQKVWIFPRRSNSWALLDPLIRVRLLRIPGWPLICREWDIILRVWKSSNVMLRPQGQPDLSYHELRDSVHVIQELRHCVVCCFGGSVCHQVQGGCFGDPSEQCAFVLCFQIDTIEWDGIPSTSHYYKL